MTLDVIHGTVRTVHPYFQVRHVRCTVSTLTVLKDQQRGLSDDIDPMSDQPDRPEPDCLKGNDCLSPP